MYWILSQVVRDDRLNSDDFGGTLSDVISLGYKHALRQINRQSLPTALLGQLTLNMNRGKDSQPVEVTQFLPYPHLWGDESESSKKLNVSERTKAYIKRQFKNLPVFAQSALDSYRQTL